ncbi:MAG TPA: phosphate propanoyltransferase [Clostridiales bacterium]|nr:phosphate propanoyltransferase [Clostridiales bacterium]
MDREYIKKVVRNILIKKQIEDSGIYYVPVAISNRHVHLSREDLEKLFGQGYELTRERDITQPGQFACRERVSLSGPKGRIDNVRVLGPTRKETQVEISMTDSYTLGVKPVLRMSGDIEATPGIKIIGPKGEIDIPKGLIVSARHLHLSDDEAELYGLESGDVVMIRKDGPRSIVLGNVVVRTGKGHSLEAHIDTDEGNAAGIVNGEMLIMEKY